MKQYNLSKTIDKGRLLSKMPYLAKVQSDSGSKSGIGATSKFNYSTLDNYPIHCPSTKFDQCALTRS